MPEYTIFQVGDQAVTISLGNSIKPSYHERVISMQRWLQQNSFPGLRDIVIAYSSLTLVYDLYRIKNEFSIENVSEFIQEKLKEAYNNSQQIVAGELRVVEIPVCYEDPFSHDMDLICSQNKITRSRAIELHSAQTYQVYMIGFLPGFPYMAEVDELIRVPRKEKPRTLVEAGSVGIAGIQTGIYPVNSPGGWQIIGRTPLILFDKNADPPVTLEPGNRVKFYPITRNEFENFNPEFA